MTRGSHGLARALVRAGAILAGLMLADVAGSRATAKPVASGSVVSVCDFGARGDDDLDDTAAIKAALQAAGKLKPAGWVLVPAGRYRYNEIIEVNGLTVRGEGATRTILEATNRMKSSWRITGRRAELCDLSLRTVGPPGRRESTPATTGVEVFQAHPFALEGLRVGPVASAGILVRESGGTAAQPALIAGCEVAGTQADGIHLTAASAYIDVRGNRVHEVGDDGIAIVSYRDNPGSCREIRVTENEVRNGRARGLSVVGGEDVEIERNRVSGTLMAGILIASESSFDTRATSRVLVRGNRLDHTASQGHGGHAAIDLEGRDDGTALVRTVEVQDNRISDAPRAGIRIGAHVADVAVRGNRVTGAGGAGIEVGPHAGDVELGGIDDTGSAGNEIVRCGGYGIHVDTTGASGRLTIAGNRFEAVNRRGLPFVDVINIGKGGTYAALTIVANRFAPGPGTRVERFIECRAVGARIADNVVVDGTGGDEPVAASSHSAPR